MGGLNRAVRWGFWGAGAIAHRVVDDLRRVSGAAAVAVASRSIESANALAAAHRIRRVHPDLERLLCDAEVDVVYVSTPHHRHAADAIACLRAGKAVLCEKPLALDELEAAAIVAEAKRAGRFCMEAMWTRFIPAVEEVSRLLRAGAIGRLRMLNGDFAYAHAYDPASRLFALDAGGGALLDRGVYLVSLAQSLLGEPVSVQADAQLAGTGVDAHSAYQLRFADGAVAQLWASLSVRGTNAFAFVGDKGRVVLHEPFYAAHRYSVAFDEPAPSRPQGAAASGGGLAARVKEAAVRAGLGRRVDWLRGARRHLASHSNPFPGYGYQFELAEVVRCLREGLVESPTMTLADSVGVARTMDRLRACWSHGAAPR
jgi:predicted dehydrogenase